MAKAIEQRRRALGAMAKPKLEDYLAQCDKQTLNLLASFQRTVVEELLRRAVSCAEDIGARSLIFSGGVASNTGLRKAVESSHLPYPVFFPAPGLATDNAAMIAAAAFVKLGRGEFSGWDLKADASLALA